MGCNLDKVQSTEAAGDVQLPSLEKLRKGTSIFELESSKVALWLYHRWMMAHSANTLFNDNCGIYAVLCRLKFLSKVHGRYPYRAGHKSIP